MPQFRFSSCVCAMLVLLLVTVISRAEQRATVKSVSAASTASNPKLTSSNSFRSSTPKDVISKRNIEVNGYSLGSAPVAKSYDPPPEFYRGPGSISATSSTSAASTSSTATLDTPYHNRDSTTASFVSKPVIFPDGNARHKHNTNNGDSSAHLANSFNSWQLLRNSASGGLGAQDRISVKTYSNSDAHGLSSGYVHGGAGGYGYESRPYGGSGGGGHSGGHYLEFPPAASGHYPTSAHGVSGGYYSVGSSAENGIPFDVYGGGKGHYAGAGGEYSYTYPDVHEPAAHKGHQQELSQKALLAKSFLIPLASAAVLGIAAALVSNPLLLQLGAVSAAPVVGTAVVGKRRRRDLTAAEEKVPVAPTGLQGLAKQPSTANALAYRAHRQRRLTRV